MGIIMGTLMNTGYILVIEQIYRAIKIDPVGMWNTLVSCWNILSLTLLYLLIFVAVIGAFVGLKYLIFKYVIGGKKIQ